MTATASRRAEEAQKGRVFYGGTARSDREPMLLDPSTIATLWPAKEARRIWSKDIGYYLSYHDDLAMQILGDEYNPYSMWERRAIFFFLLSTIYLWAGVLVVVTHIANGGDYGIMWLTVVPVVVIMRGVVRHLYANPNFLHPDTDIDAFLMWRMALSLFLFLGGFSLIFTCEYLLSHTPDAHCNSLSNKLVSTFFLGLITEMVYRLVSCLCLFTWYVTFRVEMVGVTVLEVGRWRLQLLMAWLYREIQFDTRRGERLRVAMMTMQSQMGGSDDDEVVKLELEEEMCNCSLPWAERYHFFRIVRYRLRGDDHHMEGDDHHDEGSGGGGGGDLRAASPTRSSLRRTSSSGSSRNSISLLNRLGQSFMNATTPRAFTTITSGGGSGHQQEEEEEDEASSRLVQRQQFDFGDVTATTRCPSSSSSSSGPRMVELAGERRKRGSTTSSLSTTSQQDSSSSGGGQQEEIRPATFTTTTTTTYERETDKPLMVYVYKTCQPPPSSEEAAERKKGPPSSSS